MRAKQGAAMAKRDSMDIFGAAMLIALAFLFALNQVSIKIVNGGFQPVFAAGVRSLLAVPVVLLWMWLRGYQLTVAPRTVLLGFGLGVTFAAEFICLYIALDHTTVTRSAVILYSMPVWLSLMAHLWIADERMTRLKAAGIALAFAGMAGAIVDRGSVPDGAETATLLGDVLAVGGAVGWAAVALLARKAGQAGVTPEVQLLWMLAVSAPILLLASLGFGPFLRDPGALEIGALAFQVVVVVAAGFLLWFWLLGLYPAAGVASFSFLSPLFGIALGWALLGEPIGPGLIVAAALVAAGLVLINWPAAGRGGQVPQKVRRTL